VNKMKKLTAIILICILMITGCGNSDDTGNKAIDGDLKLESNQSLVIAQVTAIYGNEIILALAEKVDDSAIKTGAAQDGSTTTDQAGTAQDSTAVTDKTGTAQDSSTTTGTAPSGGAAPSMGEMPSDGSAPSMGDMPSDGSNSSDEKSSSDKENKQSQKQMTRYQLTGEEMTATIPVGTPVTTLLGTVTTFSRIAVDNTLQIVMEKNDAGEDVIVDIYIVG
jgi:hypothetical protein